MQTIQIHPLRWCAAMLRIVARLLTIWPLLLIAVCVISPISPHVLYQYSYIQQGSHKLKLSCRYIGARGFVFYKKQGKCPVITLIDRRER